MNTLKTIFQSAVFATVAWSVASAQQYTGLENSDLVTKIVPENLKTYLNQQSDGWFAYSIPAVPNTHSMCCYNHGKQSICDLNKNHHGYGSSSDTPYTENIHVFVNLDKGQVNQIMPVGDHCEVKASGMTIDWLTDVNQRQSIQWLKNQISNEGKGDENGSLYALGLHPDEAAADALFDLAKSNAGDYSEQAVFWLGQREYDGFDRLESLYQVLPRGEVRRKLNFALSQNSNTEAVDLLKSIAQHDEDDKQQADAIFWLSQTDEVNDLPAFLIDLMSDSNSHEVRDKAIFSLSQIDNEEANHELMKLVEGHKDSQVREKALFWLAQNSPQKAKKAALSLLESNSNVSEQENAVFVLSQLSTKESSQALFDIVKGDYARNIKKKALFWLSQSDDHSVLSQLEDLL